MKVLRVIASMNPANGGPCQGIRNSIPELEKYGFHNEVVCNDEPDAPYIRDDTFTIYALGKSRTPWQYNNQLTPWLKGNITRYDVVIVHGLWLYHSYAVYKVLKDLNKSQLPKSNSNTKSLPKLFVMPHGMLDPYFQRALGRKLKAMRNWLYWKLFEVNIVHQAEGLLFTCESELNLARKPFRPYNPKAEHNIGYGIKEPPVYTQALREAFLKACPESKNRPYILFLSRIHEKKGIDNLIKAFKSVHNCYAEVQNSISRNTNSIIISEDGNDIELKYPLLVIAGPGLETSFGKKIQQLAVGAPIIFPGMLTGDAKWGAYYGCDAFILPSHQENFGIAVVEALACSKPVLISNQVNIWSEIKETSSGFIANDTLYGVVELLDNWLKLSPYEKLIMSKNARSTYEEKFSIGKHVQRLIQVIKDCD